MEQFLLYLESPEFLQFLEQTGLPAILLSLAVACIALLLEIRLPIRYYWGLVGHGFSSLLRGMRLLPAIQPWGVCVTQDQSKPMPLVACELLETKTKRVVMRTYSNHLGQYGFPLVPGQYLLRAVKKHYHMPSILDPENIEVIAIDESFVISVTVINREVVPNLDIPLVPIKQMDQLTPSESLWHYVRMFLFQLANALLILNVVLSLLGWYATRDLFYGVVLAVSVTLLFIKLYILETISQLTRGSHA